MSSQTVVGIVISEDVFNDTRREAAGQELSREEAFAQAVALQLALHGGARGIQDTYASGGPLKLVIIKQGTDTSMCDVVLH